MVTPEVLARLEYGVAVLGINALLVLGHRGGGAVKAAMDATAVPGQISAPSTSIFSRRSFSPAATLDRAIEAHA